MSEAPSVIIHSPDFEDTPELMIDTGSEVNLLKVQAVKRIQEVDANKQLLLKGISPDPVPTLGTIKITLLGNDATFHIVKNDFPIKPHGILGAEFLTERNATINYQKKQLNFHGNSIPFVNTNQIVLPATAKTISFVRVSNPTIEEGYLPRLDLGTGIHTGNALVRNRDGKAYLQIINSNEIDVTITVPTVELEEFDRVIPETKLIRHKETEMPIGIKPIPDLISNKSFLAQDPTVRHFEAPTKVHSFSSPTHYAKPTFPQYSPKSLVVSSKEEIPENSTETPSRVEKILELISMEHMNPEEKRHVREMINKNHDLFHLPDEKLGHTNVIQHRIQTTDPAPVNTKQYRFPSIHKKEIENQVNKLLENEIIKPSLSPYNSTHLDCIQETRTQWNATVANGNRF